MSKRLIIIDGNSLLFRAYYATAYQGTDKIMRTSTGVPTNAIFAFANMMVRIINDLKADDHLFVAFDTGEKTFRHEEYDDYKANRQAVPEELITQFPIAREFLDALSIRHDEVVGYEADDLAGSLAKAASKEGYKVELYTSDQDYLQLIDEDISVQLIRRGLSDVRFLDPKTLFDEFGYHAYQVPDFKGLTGDTSDNLKGVPGVGKVTATKLLAEYDTLEKIIAEADNIKGKLGENIREFKDVAIQSKHLATILTDLPLPCPLSDFRYTGFDNKEVHAFAQKYEMRQFLNNLKYTHSDSGEEIKALKINSFKEITEKEFKHLSFYVTASEDDYYRATPQLIYFTLNKLVYCVTFADLLNDPQLVALFKNESLLKYTYDYKRSAIMLSNHGLDLQGAFNDALVLTYVFDTNVAPNISAFLLTYGVNAASDEAETYAILVAKLPAIYSEGLRKLKRENLLQVYEEIEKPLTNVLIKMEKAGFNVDKDVLVALGEEYKVILENLTRTIYSLGGHEFNINSPKQLAVVLFDELGLKANRKRSTSADVLSDLKTKHPIIPALLEYRKYQKIISTYIDGFIPHIHEDAKVHTTFNQALTTTGRLSSNNPNLQNISIRHEEGREIRKAFNAGDKDVLAIDYSQIELRLLAAIANVPRLIDIFNSERDIHAETAAALFPLEDLSYARRKAKAVNFGIVYGISDFGLSEQLETTVRDARDIIQAFFTTYPEVWTYRQQIINALINDGYVTTLTGRKRYIPQINDPNYQTREFAKRAAMNAPLQGSAADLIKIAMIKVDEFLTNNKCETKLILQVHDELIFALDENEHHIVDELVKIMENVLDLPIKLKVEVKTGKTWFEAS
ncbi:MAG: DNA polymerase I [Tenericutes bacterium ADurb.Bin087]|nr:MAG: DNA polymerase I [Tenericutes bacterium ADurb.Bin087]